MQFKETGKISRQNNKVIYPLAIEKNYIFVNVADLEPFGSVSYS